MIFTDAQLKIIRRLRRSHLGLSARDVARSVGLPVHVVNRELLALQEQDYVSLLHLKWSVRNGVPLPEEIVPRAPAAPPIAPPPPSNYTTRPQQAKQRIDRNRSAWRDFRNLCEYYAECVRLDQRVPINGKAEDEDQEIVCLPHHLPNQSTFHLKVPQSWNLWAREASKRKDSYLFLGYPLHRFQWRDSASKADVIFCSPVFMTPCRFEIQGTELSIEATGSIRINEGWLERRLKNLDERRSFIQLCGRQESDGGLADSAPETWVEVANLLSHYYPDWLQERLNPVQLTADGRLKDLKYDGVYNRAMLVLPKSWKYTKRLHSELMKLANERTDDEIDRSALTRLFPRSDEQKSTRVPLEPASSLVVAGAITPGLNREQTEACEAAAEAALSVVVGPPGTGKSRVVQATLAQQAISGSNALFASRNHQALEAVVPRVNALTDPWSIMLRLARPFGSPLDASLLTAIAELVAIGGDGNSENVPSERDRLRQKIDSKHELRETIDRIAEVRESLNALIADFDDSIEDVPSADLREKLHKPGNAATSGEIDAAIAAIDAACQPRSFWRRMVDVLWRRRPKMSAEQGARRIDQAFRSWLDPRKKWPLAPAPGQPETLAFFRQALQFLRPMAVAKNCLIAIDEQRKMLQALTPFAEAITQELNLSKEIETICSERLRALARNVGVGLREEERQQLAEVLAASRNRSDLDTDADERKLSRALHRIYPVLLKHFPLAATTNLSIGRDIPLEPALFDLLVVDEASQCDIASAIPLLFRARRAMVVGDPMQLPHVTTLAAPTDKQLRTQFRLGAIEFERFSYRTVSLFDLAASSPFVSSRTTLRQHHRCHPDIADYCSEAFYKGGWTVLTERGRESGLKWTHVDDDCRGAPGGGVTSEKQIVAVVEELHRLSAANYVGSVGVVTPFRQQANRIRDRAFSTLPPESLERWRLLVDTADGFQGDERDIVLMSLPGGTQMPSGSKNFLVQGPNRFNVAVSRARRLLHVFGDDRWADSSGVRHIAQLWSRCRLAMSHRAPAELPIRKDLIGPVWEPKLAEAMREAGIKFQQQYPSGGRYLDFAILSDAYKLNVEVDGEAYHRSERGERVASDLERDQILIANGWTIVRFWVYELREDLLACIARIHAQMRILEQNTDPWT
ncbi:hypothetical protein Pla8534_40820 [Lignipirellula cremea]|uniref:ATP-dependent RecD-like DNA helicase n=1 Tax=Lignipirellula cremea TaxID=2528010 RepID=A0A518DWQ6_9BACT|nr:hypothetical protein Pla8534_40820 [Lignipirellula cremea]